jgi:hypothetical protein
MTIGVTVETKEKITRAIALLLPRNDLHATKFGLG